MSDSPRVSSDGFAEHALVRRALDNPRLMGELVREGARLDKFNLPAESAARINGISPLELLVRGDKIATLDAALEAGMVPPGWMLRDAIDFRATACADRLVTATGFERFSDHYRTEMLQAAARNGMDSLCDRMLTLSPDLSSAFSSPAFLEAVASGDMPRTLDRVLASDAPRKPIAKAMLLHGTDAAMDTAAVPLRRSFGPALDSFKWDENAILCSRTRARAVLKAMEGNDIDATLLLERMAQQGGGCAVRTAVAMGDRPLLERVLYQGRRMDATPGTDTAMHMLASHGNPALAATLLATLSPDQLNVQNAAGQTPSMLAARTGKAAVLAQLGAAGADFDLQDKNGLTVADYASLQGDATVAAALSPVAQAAVPAMNMLQRLNPFRGR